MEGSQLFLLVAPCSHAAALCSQAALGSQTALGSQAVALGSQAALCSQVALGSQAALCSQAVALGSQAVALGSQVAALVLAEEREVVLLAVVAPAISLHPLLEPLKGLALAGGQGVALVAVAAPSPCSRTLQQPLKGLELAAAPLSLQSDRQHLPLRQWGRRRLPSLPAGTAASLPLLYSGRQLFSLLTGTAPHFVSELPTSTNPSPLGPQRSPPIRHPTGSGKGRGFSRSTAPSHSPANGLHSLAPRWATPPSPMLEAAPDPSLVSKNGRPSSSFASGQPVPPCARTPHRQGTSLDPQGHRGSSTLPSQRVWDMLGLQWIHWSISPHCSCKTDYIF
ncbi:UNVERIFIED_CONTAM: hypothetical protein FKN15_069961 [Acipenser sinensis]